MKLTFKDGITTLLVFLIVLVWDLQRQGMVFPLISSVRIACFTLLVLGMFICVYGAKSTWTVFPKNPLMIATSTMGFVAFLIAILGIITGNVLFFNLLTATIVFLWAVSTLRHIFA